MIGVQCVIRGLPQGLDKPFYLITESEVKIILDGIRDESIVLTTTGHVPQTGSKGGIEKQTLNSRGWRIFKQQKTGKAIPLIYKDNRFITRNTFSITARVNYGELKTTNVLQARDILESLRYRGYKSPFRGVTLFMQKKMIDIIEQHLKRELLGLKRGVRR